MTLHLYSFFTEKGVEKNVQFFKKDNCISVISAYNCRSNLFAISFCNLNFLAPEMVLFFTMKNCKILKCTFRSFSKFLTNLETKT